MNEKRRSMEGTSQSTKTESFDIAFYFSSALGYCSTSQAEEAQRIEN